MTDTPLPADAAVSYDPYSYEIDEDPFPVYRWMRDHAPAYHNERLDFWAVTRFADNLAFLTDSARLTSTFSTSLEFMDSPKPDSGLMIWMDPPRHNRYRGLVSKAFTPRAIRELEPAIHRIAIGHLDKLRDSSSFDVVEAFTARLPMDVISELLGIPAEQRRWVQLRSNAMLHREPGNPMPTQEAMDAVKELMAYYDELIRERRARPQDDMLTRLTQVEVADESGETARLSDEDIRQFLSLLGTAGNETVTKLLATAFHELWRNPDERRAIVENPDVATTAVEETLRFDPPSQYQGRVANVEIELHGKRIPAGAKVLCINGASGRDERKYPEPDRFDVRREIDLHLGFGYGRHICIGAYLARMESRIAIQEVLARWPEYEIPADGLTRMHSSNVRGFASVILEVA